MSEIRQSVQNFVDDLPWRLSKAKALIDIFKESPELHQCSADLYSAILSTLEDIIQSYHRHVARKYRHQHCSVKVRLTHHRQVFLRTFQTETEWESSPGQNQTCARMRGQACSPGKHLRNAESKKRARRGKGPDEVNSDIDKEAGPWFQDGRLWAE